ncbi:hypothetical protein BU17DRAFT_75686 [Hysterangium stoloniferum]|nr:hypothetical protein BU17DRAFT_75686 [Hysterangium stoloniferum]
MASEESVVFNAAHAPHPNALAAFAAVLPQIKAAIVASREHWDKHEPAMWARAHALSNHQLTTFDLEEDLVVIRAGITTYGTILLGKLRIPAVQDAEGEGFVHVRVHDPPNRGTQDIMFHSIFTDEGARDPAGHASTYRALQTRDRPLEFFNE